MSSPRIGKFAQSSTVTWSNGTVFQGFLLVGIAKPTIAAAPVHSVAYGNSGMSEPIPDFYRIPIKDGKYSEVAGLFYTSDLTPPGALYYAWIYTQSAQGFYIPVAGPSASFSVTSDTITPPSFTLNNPSAGVTPTPDQFGATTVIPPSTYTLTGNVDAAGNDITGVDNLGAVSGTFSGAVSGASFTGGTVTGTTGTFSGAVSGTAGTFSGVVKIPDGSVSAPGLEFGNDTNTGIYRASADTLDVVCGGTSVSRTSSTGVTILGSGFKYFDCESAHVAFYKKAGATNFYWRRSADGLSGGSGQFEMMTLDDSGNLSITGLAKINVPAYINNAAAIAAGLVVGQLYHDGSGSVKVVI